METNVLQNSNIIDLKTEPYQLLMDYDTMELIAVDKNGKKVRVLKNVDERLKNTLTTSHIHDYNQHKLATESDSGFLSPLDKKLINKLRRIVETKFNNNEIKIRLFGNPTITNNSINLSGEILSDIGVYKFTSSVDLLPQPLYNEEHPFAIDLLYLNINELDKINNIADITLEFERNVEDVINETDTRICLLKIFVRNNNPINRENKYGELKNYNYEIFSTKDLIIPFEPNFISINLPKNKINKNTIFYAPLNGELKDEVSGRYFVKKGTIYSQSPFGLMFNSSTESDIGSQIHIDLQKGFKLSFIIDKSNISENDTLIYFNQDFKISFDHKLFAIIVSVFNDRYSIPVRNKHRFEFFSMSFTENGIIDFFLFNKRVFEKPCVSFYNLEDLKINYISIASTNIPIGNILITDLNNTKNDEHEVDNFILKNNFGIYDKDFYSFVEEKINNLNNFATLSNNNLFIFDNISGIGQSNDGVLVPLNALTNELKLDNDKFVKGDIVFVINEDKNVYDIYKIFDIEDGVMYLIDNDNKIKSFDTSFVFSRIYLKSELYPVLINGEYNKYISKTIIGNNYNNIIIKDNIPVGATVKYVKKINKTNKFNSIVDSNVEILKILNRDSEELIKKDIFNEEKNKIELIEGGIIKHTFNTETDKNFFSDITLSKNLTITLRYDLSKKFDLDIIDKLKNIKNLFKIKFTLNAEHSFYSQNQNQKQIEDKVLREFNIIDYEIVGDLIEFKFNLSSLLIDIGVKYVIKDVDIETNDDVYLLKDNDKIKDLIKIDNHSLLSLYDNDSFLIITKDRRTK